MAVMGYVVGKLAQKVNCVTFPAANAKLSLYFLSDAQNTTRALTDGISGAVTSQFSYDAFGNLDETITPTSVATNYLYTGQQFDPYTELYSLRARYYDPFVGRFTSRDTWAYNYQNPVELNRYVYAQGNPVRYTDPSGYVSLFENKILRSFVTGVAIAAMVGIGIIIIKEFLTLFPTLEIRSLFNNPSDDSREDPFDGYQSPLDSIDWLDYVGFPKPDTNTNPANRCAYLRLIASALKNKPELTGLTKLSALIRIAVNLYDYPSSVDLSNDIACVCVGVPNFDGWWNDFEEKSTILSAIFNKGTGIDLVERPLNGEEGYNGFNRDYEDGSSRQIYHVWATVNTTANGNLYASVLADDIHECWDMFTDPMGRTLKDSKLSFVGMYLGFLISKGMAVEDVAPWVETWFGQRGWDEFVSYHNFGGLNTYFDSRICLFINR
jgi:RHS repeat-associated protein